MYSRVIDAPHVGHDTFSVTGAYVILDPSRCAIYSMSKLLICDMPPPALEIRILWYRRPGIIRMISGQVFHDFSEDHCRRLRRARVLLCVTVHCAEVRHAIVQPVEQ